MRNEYEIRQEDKRYFEVTGRTGKIDIEGAEEELRECGRKAKIIATLGVLELTSLLFLPPEPEAYGVLGLSFILGAGAIGFNDIRQSRARKKIQKTYLSSTELHTEDRGFLSGIDHDDFYVLYLAGELPIQRRTGL